MYPFFRHRDKNCGADCARFHRTRRTGTESTQKRKRSTP